MKGPTPVDAKKAIGITLNLADNLVQSYVGDLDDAQLLLRPVPGMNHIAWQLGHLIASEREMMEGLKPGSCPPLPEGFAERHNKEASSSDDPKGFLSKDEYLRLAKAQREATRAVIASTNEADLDKPGPERMREWAPTVGDVLNMPGAHALMHVGQFVAVRRKLGKPALF
jgi:hypothetical protein